MQIENIWNNIVDWFYDRSERGRLIRSFNAAARESFIQGIAPTMLKASLSKGNKEYKHQFSSWMNSGFRIQALSGRPLTKDEMTENLNKISANIKLIDYFETLPSTKRNSQNTIWGNFIIKKFE